MLVFHGAAGNGGRIAHGAGNIGAKGIAEAVVGEVAIRAQRRVGFQQQVLFLFGLGIAVGEGAALGVPRRGVPDHVVMVVVLRLLDAAVELEGLPAVALGVVYIAGAEGLGVQIQAGEIRMVHLTVHVQGEADPGVVVLKNGVTTRATPFPKTY